MDLKDKCSMCDTILHKKNTATNHSIHDHNYLKFCSYCVNNEGWDRDNEKLDVGIPKELMTLISYYIKDPMDIINAAQSQVFPPMGDVDYWISRLNFNFPKIPIHIIRNSIMRFDYFYRSMNFYYENICGASEMIKDYAYEFQRNDFSWAGEVDYKMKVLYHYYGIDHDGYCSDPDDYGDVDEYLEYTYSLYKNIKVIPKEVINKKINHYGCSAETYYKILSVTYIKDKKILTKTKCIKLLNVDELSDKYRDSKGIEIDCQICNTKSIVNGDIIKCKNCT